MSTQQRLIDRLRCPEHTGENRCLPCTIFNTAIALGLAVTLAFVWPPLGAASFVIFAGVIYFRGYLIPGTPAITQRYFPAWLLQAFGKEPGESAREVGGTEADSEEGMSAEVDSAETVDQSHAEELLSSASVVEECTNEDDLCLTEQFREVWWDRIRRFRDDTDAAAQRLASVLGIDPGALAFDDQTRFVVTLGDDRIGVWDSDAAFYAELAVEPTLDEFLSEWENLSDQERTHLIAGMRAFLDRCPNCESELEQVENVRETCCSSTVVGVDVTCSVCETHVFSGRY